VALLVHDDCYAQIGAAQALVRAYMAAGREADATALLAHADDMIKGTAATEIAYAYVVANRDQDAQALLTSEALGRHVMAAATGLGKGFVIVGREGDVEPIFDKFGEESFENRMVMMEIASGLAQAYLMAGRDADFKALLSRPGNMTDFKEKNIKQGACQGASQIGLQSIADDFLGDLKWY